MLWSMVSKIISVASSFANSKVVSCKFSKGSQEPFFLTQIAAENFFTFPLPGYGDLSHSDKCKLDKLRLSDIA